MKSQKQAIEKALAKVVSDTTAKEVASLTGDQLETVYDLVYEQMDYEHQLDEINVKDVLQDLSDLCQADFLITDIKEVQDIFNHRVEMLASLLGIELEDLEMTTNKPAENMDKERRAINFYRENLEKALDKYNEFLDDEEMYSIILNLTHDLNRLVSYIEPQYKLSNTDIPIEILHEVMKMVQMGI